jgi:hypothetical protein
MRVIFLQNSVTLRRAYPNHRLWKHSLFSTPEYIAFDQELTSVMPTLSQPKNHTLETVVPQIAEVLKGGI